MILTTNTHLSVFTNDKSFLVIFSGGKKFPLCWDLGMNGAVSIRPELWVLIWKYVTCRRVSPGSAACTHVSYVCDPLTNLQRALSGPLTVGYVPLCPCCVNTNIWFTACQLQSLTADLTLTPDQLYERQTALSARTVTSVQTFQWDK